MCMSTQVKDDSEDSGTEEPPELEEEPPADNAGAAASDLVPPPPTQPEPIPLTPPLATAGDVCRKSGTLYIHIILH